uniref:Uncharacterized protein n=1 Tax=Arundo donax TaxID=35708 RepID=A0A0A9FS01_ARUDO
MTHPGMGSIYIANTGEKLEVEGNIILNLTELVCLISSCKAVVHKAAVLARCDEHIGTLECLLQLLHGVPRIMVLHQLHLLKQLQHITYHLNSLCKLLAGLFIPSNRLYRLHNHLDQPICIHPCKLLNAGHLTHAIPQCHLLETRLAPWRPGLLQRTENSKFLGRKHPLGRYLTW